MTNNALSFVFFGTPDIAVASLDALHARGLLPHLIVSTPDKPRGRGLALTSPPVALWATLHGIPVIQPATLTDSTLVDTLRKKPCDVFVLVAYGKIIPQTILDIPRLGTLNMHPSLLPKHRGPSPIESQILEEKKASGVGVSVMLLDADMDHGPVLAQKDVAHELGSAWPVGARELREVLAHEGGNLLAETLPAYCAGEITPKEQGHAQATYCKKIMKENARIDLADNAEENYRKILAYEVWPRAYFMTEKNGKELRVVITKASLTDGTLVIEKVIPEGRREMRYAEFQNH